MIIETKGLRKSFRSRQGKEKKTVEAVRGVDLQVQEGEIFGFLGPNGAGKTTTMRVLLDLIRPTSGRAEVFGIVRDAKAEGRTIFLSSHIIDEVDRTCDRVAIIREGRLVQVDRIEAIRELAFHHVELTFAAPVATAVFEGLPGVSDIEANGHIITMRVSGPIGAVITAAAQHGIVDVVSREPNLEDVFLAQYGDHPVDAAAVQ